MGGRIELGAVSGWTRFTLVLAVEAPIAGPLEPALSS
jgi:hypothetical protein